MTIHVNIGSNQGNRLALIGRAVELLRRHWPHADINVSQPVESPPWGYDSSNTYINVGVAIDIATATPDAATATEILHTLLSIERSISDSAHRNADGTYRDREIDIDLIAIDSLVVDTPELQLPHPRMHLRTFVLQPMHRLAPTWTHPMLHLTPAQLLNKLQKQP